MRSKAFSFFFSFQYTISSIILNSCFEDPKIKTITIKKNVDRETSIRNLKKKKGKKKQETKKFLSKPQSQNLPISLSLSLSLKFKAGEKKARVKQRESGGGVWLIDEEEQVV